MQKLEKRIANLEIGTHKGAVRYVVVPRVFVGPFPRNVIAICIGVPRSPDFGLHKE